MNEEEIRGKLLLPFLNDLGFDLSEILLERSFTVRFGKSKHVTGRSDILCKKNSKNLFVIELKNDSITISQDDIDQGISYATALIDNIAPFTIITNGKTTKVFDSISREEITGKKISEQSSFWKNGCTLSTDEELKIRYEALEKFVSFSSENLIWFCEKQVRDRMGTIIGNIDNPYSKFVKELYCQRKDLQFSFNKFINSDATVFGIVGAAGVGKTNAMCTLALQSLDDSFVFFYNAALISKSPIEHIAQDLNIVFSSKSDKDIVLKKLDELGKYINKQILIFIDALDEGQNLRLALELSDIALAVRNLDNVRLIVSCKSNIWKNILFNNGTPTHLFEELNKFHTLIVSLDNTPGFLLEDFSDDELEEMIPLYKKVFAFKGQITKTLLKELRNGFFLRIFSEVYSQKQIPQIISDKDLIKRYIKQSLDKANTDITKGLRILSKIGKVLINQDYNDRDAFEDKGLEEEGLLDKLNFSLDEVLPRYLFDRNILIKSSTEDSNNISFYYSKIRDYIISFHTYRLDQLSDNEFYNVLEEFYQNYIGQSAILFYIENASFNHLETLVKFKKDKSLKYVNAYNSYLENNFNRIKEKFDPYTKGDIGIILPKDLIRKENYALFPLESNSMDIIQYDDFEEPFPDLFFQKGVNRVYGSNRPLMIPDQSKTIKKNTIKELKEIIEKGKLNAYNSVILLMEQVSTILYYYSKSLGYQYKLIDYNLPRYELIYPINLDDLRDRIYKFRATHYYKRKMSEGSNAIAQMVEKAFKEKTEIPKLNISGDFPPFEELFKIVNILLEKGYNVLEKHHLPYPDKSVAEANEFYEQNRKQNHDQVRSAQFSEKQAKLYIEKFFKHLEICYKEFVDYCFPTLKDNFSFYSSMPHEYIFYMDKSNIFGKGALGQRTSKNGTVKINIRSFDSFKEAFENDKITSSRGFSFNSMLYNDYYRKVKTIDGINTSKVDDFCVIRNWVYRLLKDDMRKLFKENDVNI